MDKKKDEKKTNKSNCCLTDFQSQHFKTEQQQKHNGEETYCKLWSKWFVAIIFNKNIL